MMQHPANKAVTLPRRRLAKPGKQRGVVLLIALIALVAMMLAGIALVRSVDTGNVIAGNLAFKQAALQASDLGVNTAMTALNDIIEGDVNADIADQYFATMQPVDTNGVPTTIAWGSVVPITVSGNSIQYVIDRLCKAVTTPATIKDECIWDGPPDGGSQMANSPVFSSDIVYYRITVRVTGPHNTVSLVQAIVTFN